MEIANKEMVKFCFDTLLYKLGKGKKPKATFTNEKFPLFVTWKKKQGSDYSLRGCIGTFQKQSLRNGLADFAITSAFKDSRFPKIKFDEVKFLSCSISILHSFEDCKDIMDWEVGKHGIDLEFKHQFGFKRSATFLPQVAPEQGWDRKTTLTNLFRKGGGSFEDNKDSAKVVRYQCSKCSLTYEEYIKM